MGKVKGDGCSEGGKGMRMGGNEDGWKEKCVGKGEWEINGEEDTERERMGKKWKIV